MEIVHDEIELETYMKEAVRVSRNHPVLIDSFLQNAIELDVDAVCDGEEVLIGGIMEHIEEAGVHSGDSACVIPTQSLSLSILERVRDYTRKIALGLGVVGLVNIQLAVKDDIVYVLEANPRASRTVPFVSKATGIPLAKIAAKVMIGKKLRGPRLSRADHPPRGREGGPPPVQQAPGCRYGARARDEEHRRGDGDRLRLRAGLLQGLYLGGQRTPGAGERLHLGHRASRRTR